MSNSKDANKVARKLSKEELMQLENYDPEYKADLSTSPCKDCPNRYLGCHGNCYKYQAFRQARDEYNEMVRKEREVAANDYFCDLSKPYRHGYFIKGKVRK